MKPWMVEVTRCVVIVLLAMTVTTCALIALAPLIGAKGVLAVVTLLGVASAACLIEATRGALTATR